MAPLGQPRSALLQWKVKSQPFYMMHWMSVVDVDETPFGVGGGWIFFAKVQVTNCI